MNRLLLWCSEKYEAASPSSWLSAAVALGITTALWLVAKGMDIQAEGLLPFRAIGQLTGLWAATLMCLTILSVARTRGLEPVFGGLDRATRFHRIIGPAALALAVGHVALEAFDAAYSAFPVSSVLVPFEPGARTFDILGTFIVLVLVAFAFSRRITHERWLSLHRPIGFVFVVVAINAILLEPGTPQSFEPLRVWLILLLVASGLALLYRVALFKRFGDRYEYRLESVTPRPDATLDLVMRPVTKRMMYEPGTFVFIRVPDHVPHAQELHPFSISSTPVDRDLRVSIRMLGDFTRSLAKLEPGRSIDVYGPFGGFTPHRFAKFRRLVFIGSGIGITPFLSMLKFEETNRDFRRMWLYYIVRDGAHAPYDEEIRSSYLKADSFIDYTLWDGSARGRIKAADVLKDVAPLDDFAVMLCGSPQFVADLTRQFHAAGVPVERIITEDLLFR